MTNDKSADLILFAGRQPGEAYIAFGLSYAFKDAPMAIVPWPHNVTPGLPLAWWHCADWEALLVGLKRAGDDAEREAFLRASIETGAPAWAACLNGDWGPRPGTPENPILLVRSDGAAPAICRQGSGRMIGHAYQRGR